MIRALLDMLGDFYRIGNFHQAEVIARSLLAAVPDDLVSLQFLGLVCHRTGRSREAARLLRQASVSAARTPEAEYELGGRYQTQGDYVAAEVCYREATQLRPDFAEAWYDLGKVCCELGHTAQAAAAFRSALGACPGHAGATQALRLMGLPPQVSHGRSAGP